LKKVWTGHFKALDFIIKNDTPMQLRKNETIQKNQHQTETVILPYADFMLIFYFPPNKLW